MCSRLNFGATKTLLRILFTIKIHTICASYTENAKRTSLYYCCMLTKNVQSIVECNYDYVLVEQIVRRYLHVWPGTADKCPSVYEHHDGFFFIVRLLLDLEENNPLTIICLTLNRYCVTMYLKFLPHPVRIYWGTNSLRYRRKRWIKMRTVYKCFLPKML